MSACLSGCHFCLQPWAVVAVPFPVSSTGWQISMKEEVSSLSFSFYDFGCKVNSFFLLRQTFAKFLCMKQFRQLYDTYHKVCLDISPYLCK